MADNCADCTNDSDEVQEYHFPDSSGQQAAALLCYRCALLRGNPFMDEATVRNLVDLSKELRLPRPAGPPKCRICGTAEQLREVHQAANSGPGWKFWYCAVCIQLPPAPDLESHDFDQLLAHAQGVWHPGDPWPPRPRPQHP